MEWSRSAVSLLVVTAGLVLGTSCLSNNVDDSCGSGGGSCPEGTTCQEGECVPESDVVADTEPEAGGDTAATEPQTDTSRNDTALEGSDVRDADPDGMAPDGDSEVSDGDGGDASPAGPGTSCGSDAECRGSCERAKCAHRIFISSKRYRGTLGGLAGADRKCNRLAGNAGLGGAWKAVLRVEGDYTQPRVVVKAPVVNLKGDLIHRRANDWPFGIQAMVKYDENGTRAYPTGANHETWTGWENDTQGSAADCGDWTSASGSMQGRVGHLRTDESSFFLTAGEKECDQKSHLFCISQ